MFKITGRKGFQIRFDNGFWISIQFGPANYADHYHRCIGRDEEECGMEGSNVAEVAILGADGEMMAHSSFDGDTVGGWRTPAQVLELMNWAASQERKP